MTTVTAGVTATEVVLPGIVEPAELQIRRRQLPPPKAGEALVRVNATGISFAEQAMRRKRYPGQPKFPFVPGYDLVGTVVAVGADSDAALIGTRVAAATKTGGWATHALVKRRTWCRSRPNWMSPTWKPLSSTASRRTRCCTAAPGCGRGQTILVHGASGGVGTILAQLAIHEGIRVIGTAAPSNTCGPARTRGRAGRLPRPRPEAAGSRLAPNGVDAVFDHLGPASFRTSFELLAAGGTLVGYGSAAKLDDDNSMAIMFLGMLAPALQLERAAQSASMPTSTTSGPDTWCPSARSVAASTPT